MCVYVAIFGLGWTLHVAVIYCVYLPREATWISHYQALNRRSREVPSAGTQLPQPRPAPMCHRNEQIYSTVEVSELRISVPTATVFIACQEEVPRAGSGVVRIDPLRFLAGCRTRRLNQV